MKVLVFAKKRQTKDGKNFTAYVTKLTKKDGEEVTMSVKFREDCGSPKMEECPCYILVDKVNANMTTKKHEITDEESGEIREVVNNTLWVSAWDMSPEKYVDTSLDEFED